MNDTQQKAAAKSFAAYWKGKGYEKGESQAFWLSLLRDVYGVEHLDQWFSKSVCGLLLLTIQAEKYHNF